MGTKGLSRCFKSHLSIRLSSGGGSPGLWHAQASVPLPWGHVPLPWGHVPLPWRHVPLPWGHSPSAGLCLSSAPAPVTPTQRGHCPGAVGHQTYGRQSPSPRSCCHTRGRKPEIVPVPQYLPVVTISASQHPVCSGHSHSNASDQRASGLPSSRCRPSLRLVAARGPGLGCIAPSFPGAPPCPPTSLPTSPRPGQGRLGRWRGIRPADKHRVTTRSRKPGLEKRCHFFPWVRFVIKGIDPEIVPVPQSRPLHREGGASRQPLWGGGQRPPEGTDRHTIQKDRIQQLSSKSAGDAQAATCTAGPLRGSELLRPHRPERSTRNRSTSCAAGAGAGQTDV